MIKFLEYIISHWSNQPFYYVFIRWDTSLGIASDIIRISLVKARCVGKRVTFIRARVPFGKYLFNSTYPTAIYSVLESDTIRQEFLSIRLLLEYYYGLKYLFLTLFLSIVKLRITTYRQYQHGHRGLYDAAITDMGMVGHEINLRHLCRQFRDLPFVRLNNYSKKRCLQNLKNLGIEGKWFVCLHIRSSHFYRDGAFYRNANIENYYEAIDYIIATGGVVIRIGDVIEDFINMPRDGLIDYPNSEYKSEIMDLYLIENCRFYIGTQSGPIDTALLFNKPVVSVNSLHFAMSGTGTHGITIYKKIREVKSDRLLSFEEAMDLYKYFILASHDEFSLRYEWIENSSAEILDVVREMMLGLETSKLPQTCLQRSANRTLRVKAWHHNFQPDLGHVQALCSTVLVGQLYLARWVGSQAVVTRPISTKGRSIQ
jgi:putative glycosyltransferase (TIGR04372 family)